MPSLIAILGFDINPFSKNVDAAQAKARSGGKGIESAFGGLGKHLAGFATIGAATAGISSVVEFGGKVTDLSLRLGLSTDEVQKWDYALKQNGSSIDAAVPFFEKLGKARLRAMAGSEKDIEAFQKFGISMDVVKSGSSEAAKAIAEVYHNGGDPQALIGAMTVLGGKGAGELVAAFREGLADAFGDAPVISEKDIETLDRMGDAWSRLKAEGMATFAPAITALSDILLGALDVAKVGIATASGALVGAFEAIKELSWKDFLTPGAALGKVLGASGKLASDQFNEEAEAKLTRDKESAVALEKRRARLSKHAGGGADDEEEVTAKARKATDKLEDELARKTRANSMAELTTSEKLHALTAERRDILQAMPGLKGDEQLEAKIKAAELEKEIEDTLTKRRSEVAAKDKKEEDELKKAHKDNAEFGKFAVNQQQQSGAFFGNYASAGTTLAPEMAALNVQTKSEQHLAKIVALLSQTSDESSGQGASF